MAVANPKSKLARICSQLVPQPRFPGRGHCISVPKEIVHDPDPSIYNPISEFAAGNWPNFNSPDVTTMTVWPPTPWDKLGVQVRNLSADASANATRVDISWSAWGIGMPKESIASAFVDLARSGFPGSQRSIEIANPADVIAAKRYGIFVNISHPYDRDPSNNHSEQTIDGFQTSTSRQGNFAIPVRNPTGSVVVIQLAVQPAIWGATIVPSSVTLAPGSQQTVQFSVSVPAVIPPSPAGTLITETFNIVGTIGGKLLGGVAILVLVDA